MRRLLIGGSPDQGRYPASEVNDEACPENPVHLRVVRNIDLLKLVSTLISSLWLGHGLSAIVASSRL